MCINEYYLRVLKFRGGSERKVPSLWAMHGGFRRVPYTLARERTCVIKRRCPSSMYPEALSRNKFPCACMYSSAWPGFLLKENPNVSVNLEKNNKTVQHVSFRRLTVIWRNVPSIWRKNNKTVQRVSFRRLTVNWRNLLKKLNH